MTVLTLRSNEAVKDRTEAYSAPHHSPDFNLASKNAFTRELTGWMMVSSSTLAFSRRFLMVKIPSSSLTRCLDANLARSPESMPVQRITSRISRSFGVKSAITSSKTSSGQVSSLRPNWPLSGNGIPSVGSTRIYPRFTDHRENLRTVIKMLAQYLGEAFPRSPLAPAWNTCGVISRTDAASGKAFANLLRIKSTSVRVSGFLSAYCSAMNSLAADWKGCALASVDFEAIHLSIRPGAMPSARFKSLVPEEMDFCFPSHRNLISRLPFPSWMLQGGMACSDIVWISCLLLEIWSHLPELNRRARSSSTSKKPLPRQIRRISKGRESKKSGKGAQTCPGSDDPDGPLFGTVVRNNPLSPSPLSSPSCAPRGLTTWRAVGREKRAIAAVISAVKTSPQFGQAAAIPHTERADSSQTIAAAVCLSIHPHLAEVVS